MQKIHYILPIVLLIVSCTFTSQRHNNSKDKEEAETIVETYLDNIMNDEIESNDSLFSQELINRLPLAKLRDIQRSLRAKLGELEDYELEKWETLVSTGTSSKSEYILIYKTYYPKDSAEETFKLIKEENGKIRICFYNIHSEALLK